MSSCTTHPYKNHKELTLYLTHLNDLKGGMCCV